MPPQGHWYPLGKAMAYPAFRRGAFFAAALLAALTAAGRAHASETLDVANVSAPAINCIFNPACAVTVTDSVGDIPLAGTKATGRLQSRTYAGASGSPAAGMTAYVYRVDLSHVTGVAPKPCVTAVWISSGYPAPQQYNGKGPLEHIFVVTKGGLGSVGVASAIQEGESTKVTFTRPVCAGSGGRPGQSSFFFGFASIYPPRSSSAYVHTTAGSKAITSVTVPVRSPDYTG
jgi:hypothetical protein